MGQRGRKPGSGTSQAKIIAALRALGTETDGRPKAIRAADLARTLEWKRPKAPVERRRQTARLNRKLRLLRDHGLIGKIQGTRRYRVLPKGIQVLSAVLTFREETLPAHLADAA